MKCLGLMKKTSDEEGGGRPQRRYGHRHRPPTAILMLLLAFLLLGTTKAHEDHHDRSERPAESKNSYLKKVKANGRKFKHQHVRKHSNHDRSAPQLLPHYLKKAKANGRKFKHQKVQKHGNNDHSNHDHDHSSSSQPGYHTSQYTDSYLKKVKAEGRNLKQPQLHSVHHDQSSHDHDHDHEEHDDRTSEYTDSYLAQMKAEGRKLHKLAHTSCGASALTASQMEEMGEKHLQWKKLHGDKRNLQSLRYIVPVYFHVFKRSTYEGTLEPTHRLKFLRKLNREFKQTPFRFKLYGHGEYVHPTFFHCQNEAAYKQFARVDGSDVLNIYVCNTHAKQEGLVGFAHYPPVTKSNPTLDGVVIMNPGLKVFWDDTVFNGLVHEVGHYFGLAHTFEGGCNAAKISHYHGHDSYYFHGDGVNDTAAHSRATYAERDGYQTCWHGLKPPLQTCPQAKASGQVDAGFDPIDNYMNYLPGFCFEKYGHFTPGQIERMVAEYESYRYQPTCRWKKCLSHSDCSTAGGDPTCSGDNGALRCIAKKRRHYRKLCLPCKGYYRNCQTNEECCDGYKCDRVQKQCVMS